jgi:sterol desaturase/sphingolipid hydroxylase (fatty acid hydroxylase superfamily)
LGIDVAHVGRVVVEKLKAFYFGGDFVTNLLALVGFVAVVGLGELLARRPTARYRAASVRTDVLYTVFYVGGFYGVLFGSPFGRLLRFCCVPWLDVGLLRTLPAPLHVLLALVAFDCARYWLHRWAHASPTLWAFHRIHHSQEVLTPLTNYRFHFVDVALHGAAMLAVYAVLGTPAAGGLVLGLAITWLNLLAHTGYRWSFGPLDRVVVSPRYHGLHHSIDPAHAGRNFGFTLSVWDWLFGTMDRGVASVYGVPGPKPPESFLRQLVAPFVDLSRARRVVSAAGG